MKPPLQLCVLLTLMFSSALAKEARAGCPDALAEYSQLLNVYFSRAHTDSPRAVGLRVYGGLFTSMRSCSIQNNQITRFSYTPQIGPTVETEGSFTDLWALGGIEDFEDASLTRFINRGTRRLS